MKHTLKYLLPTRISLWHSARVVALSAALCPTAWAQHVEPIAPSGVGGVSTVAPSSSGAVAPVGAGSGEEVAAVGTPARDGGGVTTVAPGSRASQASSVQSVGLKSALVGALIEKMRAHTLTPEEAWKSGALDVDDLLYIVNERFDTWGGFNWQSDVQLRRGLVKLLAENGGEKIKEFGKLPVKVRLWLADYYGSVGDERTVELAESILRELKPKEKGQEDLAFQVVERIAWFYRDKGEPQKNARTWQRLEPLLGQDGWWLPDSLVEAARANARQGDVAEAKELLARAEQLTQGTNNHIYAVALCERALLLANEDRIVEALKALSTAVLTASNDPETHALNGMIQTTKGSILFKRKEYAKAASLCNEALDNYYLSPTHLTAFAPLVAKAQQLREWAARWSAKECHVEGVDPCWLVPLGTQGSKFVGVFIINFPQKEDIQAVEAQGNFRFEVERSAVSEYASQHQVRIICSESADVDEAVEVSIKRSRVNAPPVLLKIQLQRVDLAR